MSRQADWDRLRRRKALSKRAEMDVPPARMNFDQRRMIKLLGLQTGTDVGELVGVNEEEAEEMIEYLSGLPKRRD